MTHCAMIGGFARDGGGRFLALSIDAVVRLGAYHSQYTPFVATGCGASVQAPEERRPSA
jgi:hypothetical protein